MAAKASGFPASPASAPVGTWNTGWRPTYASARNGPASAPTVPASAPGDPEPEPGSALESARGGEGPAYERTARRTPAKRSVSGGSVSTSDRAST
jgi:hypothetical protein